MIHHRLPAIPVRSRIASAPHHVRVRIVGWKARQEFDQRLPLWRVNQVVGIEPERIITLGSRQRRLAGRGEVIDPDEIKHPCPELFSDFPRAVFRSCVNHQDLIEQTGHGG